jgi:hypothetical protein
MFEPCRLHIFLSIRLYFLASESISGLLDLCKLTARLAGKSVDRLYSFVLDGASMAIPPLHCLVFFLGLRLFFTLGKLQQGLTDARLRSKAIECTGGPLS